MGGIGRRRAVVGLLALATAVTVAADGRGGTPATAGPVGGAPGGPPAARTEAAPRRTTPAELPSPRVGWEPNRGQVHRDVRYAARARGYTAFVTDRDVAFSFRFPGSAADRVALVPVRMRLLGGSDDSVLVAGTALPGVSHYLRGEKSRWVTDVPAFETVTRAGAYPGIDMVLGSRGASVEYAFRIAPGADPARIVLAFEGVAGVSLVAGDLVLRTGHGDVRHGAPVAFQDTVDGRRMVDVRFHPRTDGTVGFALGAYDRERTLVIDPVVEPVTYHGSPTDNDQFFSCAYGNGGDVFAAGFTEQNDYPVTGSAAQTVHGGNRDAVVTRFNPALSARVYSTFLGGSVLDQANGIALDPTNRAYVAGTTASTDFPGTTNGFAVTKPSGATSDTDAFLAVLSANGSSILYGTYIGGDGTEVGRDVAVNSSGEAVVVGNRGNNESGAPAFPFTASPLGGPDTATVDGFVVAIDTGVSGAGSLLGAVPVAGAAADGDQDVHAAAIAEDGVVTVGGSSTTAISTTGAIVNGSHSGSYDGILARFSDTSLATVVYADHVGGTGIDEVLDIAVVGDLLHYCGTSNSVASFPFASPLYTHRGGTDAFAGIVDTGAATLAFSTMWGGSNNETAPGLAVDASGTIHLTGGTDTDNGTGPFNVLPLTGNALDTTFNGVQDAYFVQIATPTSSPTLAYASYFGGSGTDTPFDLASDDAGNTLIAGWTNSGDFPVTAGVVQGTLGGPRDGFAAVLVTQTMTLRPDFAHLTDAFAARGDKIKIDGNIDFTANATNTTFNPATDALTVTIRHNGETHTIAIAAGDPKWKSKGAGLYTIKRYEVNALTPEWTVSLNFLQQVFTVTKVKFDFVDIPDPAMPVILSLVVTSGGGDNDGTVGRFFREGAFNTLKNNIVLRYNE